MTAFAQLGCLRLNAKRSIVTLLGTTRQFIIAEATKSLSLMSDSTHADGDELWFGNSFIDREGGISADAMYAEPFTAHDPDGSSFTASALFVGDISTHESYKTRGYAGHGVNFYCGVPITTSLGHVIGVYTVTDDKPRDHLTATELRFLVDMSVIVLQHLEMVRNDRSRKRGERLINGIGAFIEGNNPEETSQPQETSHPTSQASEEPQNGPDSAKKARLGGSNQNSEFLGMVINDANPSYEDSKRLTPSSSDRPTGPQRTHSSAVSQEHGLVKDIQVKPPTKRAAAKDKAMRDSQQVFNRAAAIMRSCLRSDGAIFLNASSANLSPGSRMDNSGSVSKVHHDKPNNRRRPLPKANPYPDVIHHNTADNETPPSSDESTSTRSHSDSSTSQKRKTQRCQVLGISLAESAKFPSVSDQSLRRLVRRYPKGKCFSFDQDGRPASSGESSESALSASDTYKDVDDSGSKAIPHVPTTSALLKALPGARNIVFLPLWDFGKERWHSGLALWSNDPGSLTNVEDNMVYLKAFSNAIMNEVNRTDLLLSDTAKSTFLANISHELRSPLHGILGSIEFLHDTAMDDFQSSMVISVETCGKTLLDTVNHVLDHSKIHNLVKSHRHAKSVGPGGEHSNPPETSLTEDFDMAIVVEEAVEAVYAGQVFRTANKDALEGKTPIQTTASRAMQQRQDRRENISKGAEAHKSPVCLTLNIDDYTDWRVRTQPGAVRRIVMNILGNALKYTAKGCIDVSLEVDRSRSKTSSNLHMTLQFSDTGFGMSDDFMKNHAFTAFSQEDSLATGIGLGLSIVRQIVDSIGGKIDLSSKKDVGTEVRIWLSLPKSREDKSAESESNIIPEMRKRTTGREMCMLVPYEERMLHTLVPMPTIDSSLRNMMTGWFRMKVTSIKAMEDNEPDFFIYPEPPPIDYLMNFHGKPKTDFEIPVIILCTNAFEAASLRSNGVHYLTDIGRIIEVIAQPCGPQKMAKVLHRCMQRLEMLKSGKVKIKPSQNVPLSFKKKDAGQVETPGLEDGPAPKGEEAVAEYGQPAPNPPLGTPSLPEMQSNPLDSPPFPKKKSSSRRASLTKTDMSDETSSLDPTPATNGETVSPKAESKPRMLVVDDNHINLHLLVTFLRRTGHPHESANDGLKAVEAYQNSVREEDGKGAFRYILMDISMPVMDGMSATKEIRKFERENGIKEQVKIIALTGMGGDLALHESKGLGFDQFLSKPIKFKDLVKLLV